ncbi:MAG TPA: NirD/YgiW/YdeI family stress tolerance protein [Woeseiaceae bacterium]|nr:NirD/YgiW/YdeI family stress tolerance protein [Woeseiaceae bacterium]
MKRKQLLACVLAAAPLMAAAGQQQGGFVGPDARQAPVTAAEAMNLPDDASVRLVGYIVRSLGDERYEFKDDSGTLIVEIDDDDWGGLEVRPEDRVELAGEIDREGQSVEIDVDTVRAAR